MSLPFIQAARVTYWCDKLKDLGPEIRGRVHAAYAEAPLLDLDSVLSFLHHIKLRVSVCVFVRERVPALVCVW